MIQTVYYNQDYIILSPVEIQRMKNLGLPDRLHPKHGDPLMVTEELADHIERYGGNIRHLLGGTAYLDMENRVYQNNSRFSPIELPGYSYWLIDIKTDKPIWWGVIERAIIAYAWMQYKYQINSEMWLP